MRYALRKSLIRFIKHMPKSLAAVVLIATSIAMAMPADALAAQSVRIATSAGIANISAGNKKYHQSISAKSGQKIFVAVSFKTMEAANSGKTAKNVHVTFTLPTGTGTSKTITIKVKASNSNTTTNHLGIQAANSGLKFAYTPGTAVLWYGTTTHRKLSDRAITSNDGVVINSLAASKQDSISFYGTLKAAAKPGVKVSNQSQVVGKSSHFSAKNTAMPGDTLKYRLTFKNSGNITEKNVVLRDKMSTGETLVPNSTVVFVNNSNGKRTTSNQIAANGLTVGAFKPGATAIVEFEAKLASSSQLACSVTEINNVGSAQPKGMKAVTATATTDINNACTTPVCTAFSVTPGDNRTAEITKFQTSANHGATFSKAVIDWGDGATLTTDKPQGKKHQYTNSDQRTVRATAHFQVNGQDKTSTCPAATIAFSQPTTPTSATTTAVTTTPQQLVNTGAGNIFGLFFGVVASSFIGYRLFIRRQLARR